MASQDSDSRAFYPEGRPDDYSESRILASLRRYAALGSDLPGWFVRGLKYKRDSTRASYFTDPRLESVRRENFEKRHSVGKNKYFDIPDDQGE